ncbi:MAG: hypothetical protein WAL32_11435 [Terriglobales bacterium]
MTCQEFERVLPELEGGRNFEADEHLRMCSRCWDLVADLDAITQQARALQASEEPSPRVWNSIEIALRQEGLIRRAPLDRPARQGVGWGLRWLAPAAAALLLVSGVVLHQYRGDTAQLARIAPAGVTATATAVPQAVGQTGDEDQLLNMVAARAPGLRAGYASSLRAVDAYIRDAESSARQNPNDEIAQQYLTNAYEQRAMIYEIGMERSLP